jgi:hypothetical protein
VNSFEVPEMVTSAGERMPTDNRFRRCAADG